MTEICIVCCREESEDIHCDDCKISTCVDCFFDFECGNEMIDFDGDYIMLLTI